MKIKFTSPKEKMPTREQGLEVLYAPGKRLAFKLRWYLILLAVGSPFLWLLGSWLVGLWIVNAPAQLVLPTMEVRAPDNAQVTHVNVQPGDSVQQGDALVIMDNSDWRARLALLNAQPTRVGVDPNERQTRERLVARARDRLQALRPLLVLGAATRAEVMEAQDQLDRRQLELDQYDRLAVQAQTDLSAPQRQAEQQWLLTRLAGLNLKAPTTGIVNEVFVLPNEHVGAGTPLLTMKIPGEPKVLVYLGSRHGRYASPGQSFKLKLPDGSWIKAKVVRAVDDAVPVPQELRAAFSAPTRNLKVVARLIEPLPNHWQIQNLGLEARFK